MRVVEICTYSYCLHWAVALTIATYAVQCTLNVAKSKDHFFLL